MSQQEPLGTVLDRLRADQKQRWLAGDRRLVESYLLEFPALLADQEILLDFIFSEFRLHTEVGERPDPDEYYRRFPWLVEELKPVFELELGLAPPTPPTTPETTLSWPAGVAAEVPRAAAGSFPRAFGNYELLAELGRGAMGVVFRARQIGVDRPVALKMIRSRFATPHDVERFYLEARAAGRLKHRGIVSVIEVGTHDGEHFISMELVAGQNLAARISAAPIAWDEAARLMREIASAVHYAHEQGVIHRDLKPNNILIASIDGQPIVADFGLAKIVDADTALTAGDYILGTPEYMSPEQASGGQAGPHCDIYALGAILYCLVSGKPPFHGSSAREILSRAIESQPVPLRSHDSRVPRDLETICLKCLAKEPRERYASAQEICDELDRYLRGEPIHARPTSVFERLARTLSLPRLGPEFHHWEIPAFASAAVMLVASLVTAIAPTIGAIIFYLGFGPLIGLLLYRSRQRNSSRGIQIVVYFAINLALCGTLNFNSFGSVMPRPGGNIWPNNAVVNCLTFMLLAIVSRVTFFYWTAGSCLILAVALSRMQYQWSCITYGIAWTLFFAFMGCCFRWLDRPPRELPGRESRAAIAAAGRRP